MKGDARYVDALLWYNPRERMHRRLLRVMSPMTDAQDDLVMTCDMAPVVFAAARSLESRFLWS